MNAESNICMVTKLLFPISIFMVWVTTAIAEEGQHFPPIEVRATVLDERLEK